MLFSDCPWVLYFNSYLFVPNLQQRNTRYTDYK